ncbi:MAG: J domain-containing protein [Verrucomicrobiota bacterium]
MSLEYKNYYAILGVARFASEGDIRNAFRRLAQKYHPDVASIKSIGEERFKEVNEAYEVLSDPERRREYDSMGVQKKRKISPPSAESKAVSPQYEFHFRGTGFSDFFQNLLGSMTHRIKSTPLLPGRWFRNKNRGKDIEADLLVTLEEVVHGSRRTITVERTEIRGKESEKFVYEVNVPPGVIPHQAIRMTGQGEPGKKNGSPGDLLLYVHYAKHPDFEVKKTDLFCEIVISPWEAVLGCKAPVRTLEGESRIQIPAGTQNGQKFRLREQGLPNRDCVRGDLFVTVFLQVPPQITSKERAYWEQLARNSKFNPRNT